MSARHPSVHRNLTRDSYVVASPRARRRAMLFASVLPVAMVLAVAGLQQMRDDAPPALPTDEQLEARALRDTLNKVRLELEMELATRSELERQVTSLNDQLKRAREELAFVKSTGARAASR